MNVDRIYRKASNEANFTRRIIVLIAGMLFIIIAIAAIAVVVVKETENNNIKNNGIKADGIIENISTNSKRTTSTPINLRKIYSIKYVVNNETYYREVALNDKSFKIGDVMTIYYLPNNPTKVYVPLEDKANWLAGILAIPFALLGVVCIWRYKISKYNMIQK